MKQNTKELIEALKAVTTNAERIANALMTNQIPPDKQREYASLLEQLASLLFEHADEQEKEAEA